MYQVNFSSSSVIIIIPNDRQQLAFHFCSIVLHSHRYRVWNDSFPRICRHNIRHYWTPKHQPVSSASVTVEDPELYLLDIKSFGRFLEHIWLVREWGQRTNQVAGDNCWGIWRMPPGGFGDSFEPRLSHVNNRSGTQYLRKFVRWTQRCTLSRILRPWGCWESKHKYVFKSWIYNSAFFVHTYEKHGQSRTHE